MKQSTFGACLLMAAVTAPLVSAQADLNGNCYGCIMEGFAYCAETPFATVDPKIGRCIAFENPCTANLAAGETDVKKVTSFAGCEANNVKKPFPKPDTCSANLVIDKTRLAEGFQMFDEENVKEIKLKAGEACKVTIKNESTSQIGSVGFD